MSKLDKQLTALLRDFGYRVAGNDIISVGIRGFTSDAIFGHCRDLFDAAEYLCPIIHDDEYTTRLTALTAAV